MASSFHGPQKLICTFHTKGHKDKRLFSANKIAGCRRKVRCLWDTGSELTLLNDSLRRQFSFKPTDKMDHTDVHLRSANGTPMQVTAKYLLHFKGPNYEFKIPTYFVKDLAGAGIIGADAMDKYGITVDVRSQKVTQMIPMTDPIIGTEQENHGRMLRAINSVTVPAGAEVLVPTTASRTFNKEDMYEVKQFLTDTNIIVHDGIYTSSASGKRIGVVVANVTDCPMYIAKDQYLAYAMRIENDHMRNYAASMVEDKDNVDDLLLRAATYFAAKVYAHIPEPKTSPADQVDLSTLSENWKPKFRQLFKKFDEVLSKTAEDVGNCPVIPQQIKLTDERMVASTPPYRLPENLKPIVHDYVDRLLKADVIRKSTSPFSSPLMLVKKPHAKPDEPAIDQYRVVNDFRKLNKMTIKDSYPMRNIYELIDDVASAKYLTVLDLKNSFWAQQLTEDSKKYTAFPVPGRGQFEYNRSAQGLVNSSNTFQRMVDFIMQDMPYVRCYIDDIVIYSNTLEEHHKHIENVLARLQKYNLKISPRKIQVANGSITYLGYDITPGKAIQPGKIKCQKIAEWHAPRNVEEIRQFLGLCSFFRRTIENYASIAAPLNKLTRKDAKFDEGTLPEDALQAYKELRQKLCARPCLKPVDFALPFFLTTDASTEGLGAVLSQSHDGVEHPVAYASRLLTAPEQKYAPFHLEHLAMVFGCKHFAPYLKGKEFTIRTDHKPLTAITSTQTNNLTRLKAELDDFMPFTVVYINGKQQMADMLSRPQRQVTATTITDLSPEHIRQLQKEDLLGKALAIKLRFNSLPDKNEELRAQTVKWIPLAEYSEEGLVKIKHLGHLLTYAPESIRHNLLQAFHDHPTAGHYGAVKTKAQLLTTWWWPTLTADVERYVKDCHTCQKTNQAHSSKPAPLGQLPPVSRTFDRVHIDLLQLPTTTSGSKYALVMVDAFSKWTEVRPLASKAMDDVANQIIKGWIARYGPPRQFHSDNGTEFTNKILKAIMGRLGITHSFSTPLHPQSNGQVERVNKDIVNYLTKYFAGNNEWEDQLPLFCWAHNSTVTASTGLPPFTVVFGSSPRLPFMPQETKRHYADDYFSLFNQRLTLITDYVKHMQRLATERGERTFNKNAVDKEFDIGSRVYLTSIGGTNRPQKLKFKFEGPYLITNNLGNNMYEVKRESDGKITKAHANRVKLVLPAHAMQEIVPPTPDKEHQEGPLPRLQRILKRVKDLPKRLSPPSSAKTSAPSTKPEVSKEGRPRPEPEPSRPRDPSTPQGPSGSNKAETEPSGARDPWNRTKYNLRRGPRFVSSCWTPEAFRPQEYTQWHLPSRNKIYCAVKPVKGPRPLYSPDLRTFGGLRRPPEWVYHQPSWHWAGPSFTWPSW